jgi:hypothetical protein
MVQGLHLVGSARSALVQLALPLESVDPSQMGVGALGTSQQPKQSQPLGVSGPQ